MSTKTQAKSSRATTRSAASSKRNSQPKAPKFALARAPEPAHRSAASAPAKTTKRDQLAALLIRDQGATLEQMIAATSWLPHTVRAALTGLRKQGYAIDSDKVAGLRTYRAVAPQ